MTTHVLAAGALAADGPDTEKLLGVLLIVVLGLVACVGIGATALLLRIILPGVAAAADRAIERLSMKRLVLSGVLPLVGAALVAQGVGAVGSKVLDAAFLLLVALPLIVAWLVGAIAAIPRIGAGALRGGRDSAPIARCAIGGLVIGFALLSWALPPLGVLVSLLLASWFVGAGIGAAIQRTSPAAVSDTPPADEAP